MNTSGDGVANVILYLVVLALFVQVAVRMLRAAPARRPLPVIAIALAVLIGVPSLLQFALPALGAALRRNPPLTVHEGQWWRVLTSIGAQDGGPVAAVFNLVVILVVVALAEWVWGRWRTVVLFLLPAVILNLLALTWGATGGGSSFASDGLLMSVMGLALVVSPSAVVRILAVVSVVLGAALVALDDAHGLSMLVGAALGVVAAWTTLGASARPTRARAKGSPMSQLTDDAYDRMVITLSADPDDDVTVTDDGLLVRGRLFAFRRGDALVVDLDPARAADLVARRMVAFAEARDQAKGTWVSIRDLEDWTELATEAHQFVGEPAVGGDS